jgi:cell division protein FtsB
MRNKTLAWLRTDLELQREYTVELIMVDTPVSENDRLRAENDRLRAENDRLRAENDRVRAENDRLRAENDRVRAENDRVRADDMLVGLDPIVELYLSRTGFQN